MTYTTEELQKIGAEESILNYWKFKMFKFKKLHSVYFLELSQHFIFEIETENNLQPQTLSKAVVTAIRNGKIK